MPIPQSMASRMPIANESFVASFIFPHPLLENMTVNCLVPQRSSGIFHTLCGISRCYGKSAEKTAASATLSLPQQSAALEYPALRHFKRCSSRIGCFMIFLPLGNDGNWRGPRCRSVICFQPKSARIQTAFIPVVQFPYSSFHITGKDCRKFICIIGIKIIFISVLRMVMHNFFEKKENKYGSITYLFLVKMKNNI